MLDGRSSNPRAGRINNFHVVVSSFAAIGGLALAAYQVFGPHNGAPEPVKVTVSLEQTGTTAQAVEPAAPKSDALTTSIFDPGATITSALKDGSDQRYDFSDLFDGSAETSVTLSELDREINVLVTFPNADAREVRAITYTPPADIERAAEGTVDVTVLPEGQMEASGRPVYSFSFTPAASGQTFSIPGSAMGKGVWLRVAAEPGSVIGDFSIVRAQP